MKSLSPAALTIVEDASHLILRCSGAWTLQTLAAVAATLESLTPHKPLKWDIADVIEFDSSGVALWNLYSRKFSHQGFASEIIGGREEHLRLYGLLYPHPSEDTPPPDHRNWLYRLGRETYRWVQGFDRFLNFLGEAFIVLINSLRHPGSIRYRAIGSHIITAGFDALPIIAISSFLIGVVVAFQSIVQLQKFGADVLIVDMIGISLTRELAPLITAIVIAGRSASAFTAQIGAMKMNQEIDAMKTMGFHPYLFLVWPRVIALMMVMPLLIFFADIVGIFGGMVIASTQSHLSYTEFINRLQGALPIRHFIIGIAKGPFFALLIALAGTYRGFQVSLNTESIGLFTTKSVVNAIFLVIACDALFSVLLTELKL
ncbi:MAG: phospholipid/cholesterol/gamma-HCH transport system permease protein [Campylobacterota bacterium]|nr:phospholipid/cholesterol/gamma-HCH transport system permease protein [Campylobacterota bacterium]